MSSAPVVCAYCGSNNLVVERIIDTDYDLKCGDATITSIVKCNKCGKRAKLQEGFATMGWTMYSGNQPIFDSTFDRSPMLGRTGDYDQKSKKPLIPILKRKVKR